MPRQVGASWLRRRLWVIALVVVVVAGGSIAWAVSSSKGGPLPTISVQPPVATTLSWFSAVNSQDMPLALAHFVPADRGMMEWSQWGPPFNNLHCSLSSEVAKDAHVLCTFDKINDPETGMSNTSFWSVYLQQEPSGRWLINSYGQP
jgi:hypothetical protein